MGIHNHKWQGFRGRENSAFYKHRYMLLGAAIIIAVLALSAVLYFSGVGCVWKYLFHISCPTCGITRAYISLFSGDIAAAFRYNFMFPAVPVLAIYLLFGDRLLKRQGFRVLLSVIVLGFFIKWIIYV